MTSRKVYIVMTSHSTPYPPWRRTSSTTSRLWNRRQIRRSIRKTKVATIVSALSKLRMRQPWRRVAKRADQFPKGVNLERLLSFQKCHLRRNSSLLTRSSSKRMSRKRSMKRTHSLQLRRLKRKISMNLRLSRNKWENQRRLYKTHKNKIRLR